MFNLFTPKTRTGKRRGFTLLELIVVTVVLAILAAVGVVTYTKVTDTAKDKVKQISLELIGEAAAATYNIGNGSTSWAQAITDATAGVTLAADDVVLTPGQANPISGSYSTDVLNNFLPRLTGYEVNKKTIKIPVDWKIDGKLLKELVAARIAEF